MSNTDEQAEARWAAAARLAQGVRDDGFRRRRAKVLLGIAALLIGTWIAGVVTALVFLPRDADRATDAGSSASQIVVQAVFLGLGLIVGIGGFVWAKRTGRYVTRWTAVASPLTRAEKKNVQKQISGKAEPDRAHLPIILAIASQNRRATLGLAPIYFAIVLFAVATAIGSNLLFIKLVELLVSLLLVALVIQIGVLFRRAGRFIETNREP